MIDRYLFRGFYKQDDVTQNATQNATQTLYLNEKEIKGRWIEGYYWTNGLGNYFIRVIKEEKDNFSKFTIEDFEVIPETIGQWTGITDKNGKKIFENDNLKMFQIDYDSETENGYGESTFEYKEIHINASLDFIYSYELYGEFLDDIEVIGTIFDKEVK